MHRCACKRVKRRDIFYIYGYLPLLCSRAGGLRQRANRPPSFPSPVPSSSFLLSPSARRAVLCPVSAAVLSDISVPVAESSAQDAQAGGRTMCHLWCAIPYSVSTMICSRLVPRSRWISFIGVRVCPTSIYRRGAVYGVQPIP